MFDFLKYILDALILRNEVYYYCKTFQVGLPSISGINGGMMVIVPGVMGICLWGPPVDKSGNSVRGYEFCVELGKKFSFHRYCNVIISELADETSSININLYHILMFI